MVLGLLVAIGVLVLAAVVLLVILLLRSGKTDTQPLQPLLEAVSRTEGVIRDELGKSRTDAANASQATRQELGTTLMNAFTAINGAIASAADQAGLQSSTGRQEVQSMLTNGIKTIADSLAAASDLGNQQAAALRVEVQTNLASLGDSLRLQLGEIATANSSMMNSHTSKVDKLLESVGKGLDAVRDSLESKLTAFQQSNSEESMQSRKEIGETLKGFSDSMHRQFSANTDTISKQFESFSNQILTLTTNNETKMEAIRQSVETRLQSIQEDNGKRLEEMRVTVDEKLHATLETRLSESFKLVSERLDLVHTGLGEMKALGAGVGDLKRVLSGVKTRGILGEVLLGSLLEQMLSPEQYEKNVCVREGSSERVDYAIKMPGQDGTRSHIYLSIDSKFPMEDFQRLQVAYEEANVDQIEVQLRQLETRIKAEGKSIRDKYINVPLTCDFAILFLPNENLFAEVLRRPGLQEYLSRECHVTVCGPTNLAGFLNSLSMGFRTLAIAKKSSEVWGTLGVVKTEFGKFSDILEGVKKKLIEATGKIDSAATRSRAIERKLRDVEALPVTAMAGIEEVEVESMPDLLAHLPDDPEVN